MSNVPKLRFSEFEDDWDESQLSRLIKSLDAGVSVNSTNRPCKNNEQAILKTSCVSNGYFEVNANKAVVSADEALRLKEAVSANTIIISRMNTPALVGANAFVKVDTPNIFLPDRLWSAKLHKAVCPEWVALLTSSPKIRGRLSARATGTSGSMKNITKGDVLTLPVTHPKLKEQQKIAAFLTAVDTKIEQLTKKEQLLQQYKKGVMQKLFSQEVRFKADDGSEFPDWEEKALGSVSDVRDGTHESPKYTLKGYPLVTSKNLGSNGRLNLTNVSLISEKDYTAINRRSKVAKGDILFGMIGTIGNPVRLTSEDFAIKNVALIKELDVLENSYLIHYLATAHIAQQFYRQNAGGTQKFLSLSVVRALLIKLPCKMEQVKISKFLTELDLRLEQLAQQLEAAKTFKKGLLQQMFV